MYRMDGTVSASLHHQIQASGWRIRLKSNGDSGYSCNGEIETFHLISPVLLKMTPHKTVHLSRITSHTVAQLK